MKDNTNTVMKYLVFIFSLGAILFALVTVPVLSHAQTIQQMNDADPILPPPEPHCELHIVAVETALVQACAGENCQIITTLPRNANVCTRGAVDTPGWFYIDLDIYDANSALYFIAGGQLRLDPAGQSPELCQGWLSEADPAKIYRCPDFACPVIGELARDEFACAAPLYGQYDGWYKADYSDAIGIFGELEGWIFGAEFRPSRSNTGSPRLIPTSTPRQVSAFSTPERPQPTVTPIFPLVKTQPLPLCQDYHVSVYQALVRSCAGLECEAVDRLNENEQVCVRRQSDNPEWFIVDLAPDDNTAPLYAMNREVITVGAEPMMPERPYCDIWEVTTELSVRARQCPSLTCPVLDGLATGEWLCVFEYGGGQFREWVRGDIPNGATGIWVHSASLQERADLAGVTPTPRATAANRNRRQSIQKASPIPHRYIAQAPSGTPTPIPTQDGGQESPIEVTLTPTLAPTAIPEGPVLGEDGVLGINILLDALRVDNLVLQSPLARNQFSFRVPENWSVTGSNRLILSLEYFEQLAEAVENSELVTFFDIYLDDVLVSNLRLNADLVGAQTVEIVLPNDILNEEQRRHTITFELRAEDHCELNSESQILVRGDQSYFGFNYQTLPPVLNLATYPQPFFHTPIPGVAESVFIVLPDAYSNADLQAAASIVSGLGLLTSAELQITTVTASDLLPSQLQNNNLILVGMPDEHPLIRDLYTQDVLPSQLATNGTLAVNETVLEDTDGLVQLIAHPENPQRAILVVTGQQSDGVLKAAQSLAGPPALLNFEGAVAIVTDTRPLSVSNTITNYNPEPTFAQLGFDEGVLGGLGEQVAEVAFVIPNGYTITNEATVEVGYNFSEIIATGDTTLILVMNEEIPIASRILTAEDGSVGPYQLLASIPPTAIIPGQVNTLQVLIDIDGEWNCEPPDPEIAWFTLDPQSQFNLPIEPLNPLAQRTFVGEFPAPYNEQLDLRNIWISLPDEPTTQELDQTMKLLAYLASETINGEGMQPIIHQGDLPDGTDTTQYHFMVIGRPSTNTFLANLNASLPQPFASDSDQLEQVLDDVVYRLPEGYGVGVLQMLPSPWNDENRIFVLTGTDSASQANALEAVYSRDYGRSQFAGDVVFVSSNTVNAIDTSELEWATELLEEGIPALETQTAQEAESTPIPPTLVGTATPGPTLTPIPSNTPAPTSTPTLLFTLTPTVAAPTAFPTFAPLAEEQISPVDIEPPAWINILLGMTAGIIGITLLFGLYQLFRWRQSSR